jgi:hypothetical protein
MKYVSVVILIALMSWTWCLATTERTFSLEEHKRVEAGVESDIRSFIARKYPETTDLYCQKLYTEAVEATVMLAHFRCRTEGRAGADETVTQMFEGHLRLSSQDGFKTWKELDGSIRASQISFNQGVKISSEEPKYPSVDDVTKPTSEPKSDHK